MKRISIGIAGLFLALFAARSLTAPLFPFQHTVSHDDMDGVYDEADVLGVFHGTRFLSHKLPESSVDPSVLGDSTGEKRIEIDLTKQRLYAYEGDRLVYDFIISSGLYDWTPRGVFHIWVKLRYTKMEGGSRAHGTYYYLPNVPFTMYFYNQDIPKIRGFGIHGTYWHNDFGRPKSHGCINMKTEEAELLYYWAQPDLKGKSSIYAAGDNPGTTVIIYGKYGG